MKNTVKFLALAFVAGALMLTACKKDNNSDENTPGTTVAVNFDGTQLPIGYTYAICMPTTAKGTDYDFNLTAANKGAINGDYIDLTMPYTDMLFDNANRDRDIVWKMGAGKAWGIDALDLFKNRSYEVEDYIYGDWTIAEDRDLIAFDVNEFDATSLSMTFTTTASMLSMDEYMDESMPAMEDCTHKNLTINVGNLVFSTISAKDVLTKRIVK